MARHTKQQPGLFGLFGFSNLDRPSGPSSGGFLSGLFGGSSASAKGSSGLFGLFGFSNLDRPSGSSGLGIFAPAKNRGGGR